MPWPDVGLRRISVNSFGFGGSNAHAILDDAYHTLEALYAVNGLHSSGMSDLVLPARSNGDNHSGVNEVKRLLDENDHGLTPDTNTKQRATIRGVALPVTNGATSSEIKSTEPSMISGTKSTSTDVTEPSLVNGSGPTLANGTGPTFGNDIEPTLTNGTESSLVNSTAPSLISSAEFSQTSSTEPSLIDGTEPTLINDAEPSLKNGPSSKTSGVDGTNGTNGTDASHYQLLVFSARDEPALKRVHQQYSN